MIRTTALPHRMVIAAFAAGTMMLSACSSGGESTADAAAASEEVAGDPAASNGATGAGDADNSTVAATKAESTDGPDAVGSLSSDEIHELSFEFDEADYTAMIDAYTSTGDKEWIEATVTIDGVTYDDVGIRLKGNSSLRGIAAGDDGRGAGPANDASAEDPSSLPWLVKLDKYVDGQSHEGLTDLVVRSNNTETALNEAVALELLEAAGLASQDAIAAAFSVNGSDEVLRLVIEHPDDVWMDEWLDGSGALYKAESTGDYSYRGDDPDAYDDVFDQEAGKDNADLTPLIEFLEWLNTSDDETFAAELADRLDVDAFATYLAMQELIDNFDDIDGPGNNSYLYYDTETEMFTVVAWDHNLAFGTLNGGGGAGVPGGEPPAGAVPEGGAPGGEPPRGAPADGELPDGGQRPDRGPRPEGAPEGGLPGGAGGPGGQGGPSQGNLLSERFLEVDEWQALVEQRVQELRAELYESGVADAILAAWAEVVGSSGLVDEVTIATESAAVAAYFD